MGSGKHAPSRLRHLLGSQTDQIEQLRSLGFVLTPELSYAWVEGAMVISGYVRCEGGLYMQVHQRIRPVARAGAHALFCVEAYSYSGILSDVGTLFRYDSPHADHNTEHHVHEFAIVGDRASATVRFLYKEDEVPTLADALWRLYHWHLANPSTEPGTM